MASTQPDNLPEYLYIKGENYHSKHILSVLLEHEGKLSKRKLAELTGYDEATIYKYWKNWNYDERLTKYHEHQIKQNAENSIKKNNKINQLIIEQAEQYQQAQQEILDYCKDQIIQSLQTAGPKEIIRMYKDLPSMTQTNQNNTATSKEQLLDALQYINTNNNENLDITLEDLQNIFRGNYDTLFEAIRKNQEKEE